MRPAYALLLIGSLACGGAGLPPKDAPTVVSAATPTSSDWLQVQMPSAAVAFSVPGKDPKDLREFSDFASFLSYAYSTERIPDDKVKFHPKYAKFGVLKHRGLTYMLQMMSVSDDDLFMLISVHKRTMGKYEKRSKIEVNGYPGLQAERT
nr:hypothetical protein [Polyangiaceae bacterium]